MNDMVHKNALCKYYIMFEMYIHFLCVIVIGKSSIVIIFFLFFFQIERSANRICNYKFCIKRMKNVSFLNFINGIYVQYFFGGLCQIVFNIYTNTFS